LTALTKALSFSIRFVTGRGCKTAAAFFVPGSSFMERKREAGDWNDGADAPGKREKQEKADYFSQGVVR
jgi:hypothetical protein